MALLNRRIVLVVPRLICNSAPLYCSDPWVADTYCATFSSSISKVSDTLGGYASQKYRRTRAHTHNENLSHPRMIVHQISIEAGLNQLLRYSKVLSHALFLFEPIRRSDLFRQRKTAASSFGTCPAGQ